MRACLALLVVVGSGTAAPVPKDFQKPDDKTRFVGTWTMTRCNVSEKELPNPSWRTLTLDAEGGLRASQDGKTILDRAFTIDPTAAPKRMPWRNKQTGEVEYECIYQFTADVLTIAVPHDHKIPPGSLDPGPKVTVYEFKRADAAK